MSAGLTKVLKQQELRPQVFRLASRFEYDEGITDAMSTTGSDAIAFCNLRIIIWLNLIASDSSIEGSMMSGSDGILAGDAIDGLVEATPHRRTRISGRPRL